MQSIMDTLRSAADRYPVEYVSRDIAADYHCANCRAVIVTEPGDLCEQCAIEHARGWYAGMKTGRCANGAERDAGTVYHAVDIKTGRAKCGTYPARRSRWSDYHGDRVTCARCLVKLQA
jgi:hypothetical protein